MSAEFRLMDLAPELLLTLGACITLVAGATRSSLRGSWVSGLAFLVVLAALLVSIWLGQPTADVAHLGLWLTPLLYYVRLIVLGIGLLIILVNWHQPAAQERGEYMGLILFSLLGLLLTAAANDLVVLFFAIELVSIPTYVLIALSREDHRATESAVKYFFLGAMSAAILAYGLSFLYGAAGTTVIHNVASGVAVSNLAGGAEFGSHALIGVILVLAGLAFKVAAVPLHVYVADVYEGAASPITGMLGFVPKLAGFIALLKIFSAFSWDLPITVYWLVWVMAALTMTVGNVLALLQQNVKRMLAYSSVAHTGYMLLALLVGPVAGKGPMHDGVVALLFYIAVYGAMNLGVFAVLSSFRKGDREMETLDDLSGLAVRAPIAALALAVCVFSLMGFPPTAGFIGKLYVFSSAFSIDEAHRFHGPLMALAIIGVVNSAIAAAYYLRIVGAAYMGSERTEPSTNGGVPVRMGLALCVLPMLVLFAWPTGLVQHARPAGATIREASTCTVAKITSIDDAEIPANSVPSGVSAITVAAGPPNPS